MNKSILDQAASRRSTCLTTMHEWGQPRSAKPGQNHPTDPQTAWAFKPLSLCHPLWSNSCWCRGFGTWTERRLTLTQGKALKFHAHCSLANAIPPFGERVYVASLLDFRTGQSGFKTPYLVGNWASDWQLNFSKPWHPHYVNFKQY